MITIHPFQGWRPPSDLIDQTACMPYDVIDTEEARNLVSETQNTFLHVIRPEIDVPEDVSIYDDAVYEKGRENLEQLFREGQLIKDEQAHVYIYQLEDKGITQTGVFTCVSVKDYDENRILKHELTRPDKENDRTRHILTMRAHAEPVMLTCKDEQNELVSAIARETEQAADMTYTSPEGVIHRIWIASDSAKFVDLFAAKDYLYVADGHHRCKSASRAAEELRGDQDYGDDEFEFFPAVIFPMQEMHILPYNRIVYALPDDFLAKLQATLPVSVTQNKQPDAPGKVCLYIDGSWYDVRLPKTNRDLVSATLDVARLQEFILEPFLDITDPRTDKNIHFVGGIRGTQELERLVDSGKAQLGISMYATSVDELIAVSEAGELMPPKSTWFEPKLRSGLLVHTF